MYKVEGAKFYSLRLCVKKYAPLLCLASFSFSDAVRERAEKEGIVLIQQRGEIIEVLTETLKAW